MTTKFVAGLIVCAALVASPVAASAEIAAPKSADIGKAATPDDVSGKIPTETVQEKKVCKQLPSSNSRLPNRVCLTNKQWQQVEEELR